MIIRWAKACRPVFSAGLRQLTRPNVPCIQGAPFAPDAFEEDVVANDFLGRRFMIVSRPKAVHHIWCRPRTTTFPRLRPSGSSTLRSVVGFGPLAPWRFCPGC